jgi:hypothetical protein
VGAIFFAGPAAVLLLLADAAVELDILTVVNHISTLRTEIVIDHISTVRTVSCKPC